MSVQFKIGHAHLKVRNLDAAIDFYKKFLNLKVTERIGDQYAFLTVGEFHHDIALQKVAADAPGNIPHGVGLYHVAFEVPDKKSFALAYKALVDAGVHVGAVDHQISWAMYFDDPDGNGLEIYWDTRQEADGAELWHGHNLELSHQKILSVLDAES